MSSGKYSYDLHHGAKRKTEWEILKENHRLVRDKEHPEGKSTWEERLARSYESKLFKELALIDLKHYKSKKFAIRWRTASEVVQGIGEDTCGSLRCHRHAPLPSSNENASGVSLPGSRQHSDRTPILQSFELPFVYEEEGQRKETLVKVKLCSKCKLKLIWSPETRGEDAYRRRKRRRSSDVVGE